MTDMSKNMRKRALLGIAAAICALVGALGIRFLGSDQPGADDESPVAAAANVANAGGDNDVAMLDEAGRAPTAKEGHQATLVQLLQSGRSNRWIDASKTLSTLPADDQWRILVTPGVADQPEAKALREQLLLACAGSFAASQAGIRVPSPDSSAVDQWCASLQEVGTPEEFFAAMRELAADAEFQAADFRIGWFDREKLNESQIDSKVRELRLDIAMAGSPASAMAAVRGLWLVGDKAFPDQWSRIQSLSSFQQSRIEAAVVANVVARLAGTGGPNDSMTINFCATMPGVNCARGQDLSSILQANLSREEYLLVQQLTAATLASRRG